MIIQFNMKTPDIANKILNDIIIKDEDEYYEIERKLRMWFWFGEYLTINYDTEKDTMTILKGGG